MKMYKFHFERTKIFIIIFTERLYFSAHGNVKDITCHLSRRLFEPRREKTGLRGFRPGPTQTTATEDG